MVGNCDVHLLEQLGTTYSLVDAERHPGAICAAIAAGRVSVVRRPLSWATAVRIAASLFRPQFGGVAREPGPSRVLPV
jgi:hypothetical protein